MEKLGKLNWNIHCDFVIDNDYIYITGYTDGVLGNRNYGFTDAFSIKTTK